MRKSLKVSMLGALVFVVACGDSTGSLSLDDKAALNNALTTSGALAGSPVAAFAPIIVQALDGVGTMSGSGSAAVYGQLESSINTSLQGIAGTSYDGVGLVIDFTVPLGEDTFAGTAAFVFGWNGLSASGVTEFVSAGLVDLGTTTPPSGTRSIELEPANEARVATATYFDGGTNSQYAATSGSVSVSSADFSGGSTACDPNNTTPGVTCTFTAGTMSGSFGFGAVRLSGSGAESYTQSTINYTSIPSIRVSLTVSGQ